MGRVSTCQKNCNTIDLRRAQVNNAARNVCIFPRQFLRKAAPGSTEMLKATSCGRNWFPRPITEPDWRHRGNYQKRLNVIISLAHPCHEIPPVLRDHVIQWSLYTGFIVLLWWRHQMETFSALLALWPVNSPHKGQWSGALMFSLICACINRWVNNREADDLRRHRAHYDVIVTIPLHLANVACNAEIVCKL